MPKRNWVPLVAIMGFGYIVKRAIDSNAGSDSGNDDNEITFLDTIEIGAADILATLSGTKQENFVEVMTPIAAQIKDRYGIDPLITISQAAHESNWGVSGLTKKANNLFGFTGDSWAAQGKSVIWMETNEWDARPPEQITYFTAPGDIIKKSVATNGGTNLVVRRPFRSYPTWYDSVSDWAQLMAATRYKQALDDAKKGDMVAFATDVWKAGYATDPNYPSALLAIAANVKDVQNA